MARRLSAVMAGRGLRVSECSESIMQCDRLSARRAVRVDTLSGICVKRLVDKSRELRVLARGAKLAAGITVSELSAKLKCFKNRHLEAGSAPVALVLNVLCLELCQESDRLDWELPDPERRTLYEPLFVVEW